MTGPGRTRWFVAIALAGLLACGEAAPPPDTSARPGPAGAPAVDGATTATDPDPARGEALYQAKGCPACHTIGSGRLVGPDLAGVTDRREREWIVAMIVRPDSMLKHDEAARALLAEYFTPMAALGITEAEAGDLYAYLATPGG